MNIPGSYAILFFIASDFTFITSHIHNWVLFSLWLHPFILSGVISPLFSSSILGIYRPGEFIFQCPIFLPFHTIHGVLKARILKWFAIPFCSAPCFVRTLHHDPCILGGPNKAWLIVSLSQTRLWSMWSVWLCSVLFSQSVLSYSLRPHESQHARPPCPSPTPGVHSDSRPSSQWCHPAISSSVVPFSSCPQSLPASESFPVSQLFTWGGQSTGVSALASVLSKNTQTDLL